MRPCDKVIRIFFKKIQHSFWNISVEELICTAVLGYKTGNIPMKFSLTNWQNLSKTPTKVFYSCQKHIPSTGNISQSSPSIFMHDYTHQINKNQLKLFGAIVSLIFHLSFVSGSVETITINSLWKWINWSLNYLLKNRNYKLLTEQCRGGSMTLLYFTWRALCDIRYRLKTVRQSQKES